MNQNNKVINAGVLIEDILNIAQQHRIIDFMPDDLEEDINKILFSLGFPNGRTTLKIEW